MSEKKVSAMRWSVIPKSPSYSVNEAGIVINNITKKRIKTRLDACGYERVSINGNANRMTFGVHLLVALAFIPNHENKETVNHKNGIKNDNMVENLEWMTRSENTSHAYKIGLCEGHRKMAYRMGKNNWRKGVDAKMRKVVDTSNNKIYLSIVEASKAVGFSRCHTGDMLRGKKTNKTTLKFL